MLGFRLNAGSGRGKPCGPMIEASSVIEHVKECEERPLHPQVVDTVRYLTLVYAKVAQGALPLERARACCDSVIRAVNGLCEDGNQLALQKASAVRRTRELCEKVLGQVSR